MAAYARAMAPISHLRVCRPLHRRTVGARSMPRHGTRNPRLRRSTHRLLAARARGAGATHAIEPLAELARPDTDRRQRSPRQGLHPRAIRDVAARRTKPASGSAALRAIAAPTRPAARHVRPDATRRRRRVGQHRHPAACDPRRAGRAARHVRRRPQPTANVAAVARPWRLQISARRGPTNRWFDSLATEAATRDDVSTTLRDEIVATAPTWPTPHTASSPRTCATTTHPMPTEVDGCGAERYRVGVRTMLGADLDPQEMYEWAWTDFHHLRAEIATTCERIMPGAGFAEVIELLDTDPDRAEHSDDAYQSWLQEITDEALSRSKEHFEIPEVMDRCEALIPPAGSAAAAYYTGPSEDFSRPGRTWYPTLGRTMFPRWGDVTTCYHESVPGHHLQIAYAKVQAGSLSRIQRSSFIPGHGEGWALYAEQLCDEFGWFENPDYRLGLPRRPDPADRARDHRHRHASRQAHSGRHDAERRHPVPRRRDVERPISRSSSPFSETGHTEAFMRSEIDRYLGWPAQAISYKIGQREWVAARDDARITRRRRVRHEGMAHEGAAPRRDRSRAAACRARPMNGEPGTDRHVSARQSVAARAGRRSRRCAAACRRRRTGRRRCR